MFVIFILRKRSETVEAKRTCKVFGLLERHGTQVPQVALVAHEHDDHLLVAVVAQLFEPLAHAHVRLVLGQIVDEQSADSTAIERVRDGAESLLASRVPHLCLNVYIYMHTIYRILYTSSLKTSSHVFGLTLIFLLLIWTVRVENSTPMVLVDLKSN